MRRMKTRQATRLVAFLLLFLFPAACSTPDLPAATSTPFPPTASRTPVPTFAVPTATPTITPLACLSQPGAVEPGKLESTKPPQTFLVYLPPCYAERSNQRYPVLYLLHGQTYTDDQWIRLGAVDVMNELLHNGEIMPFIIVFPDDHYWNSPVGTTFGARLVNELIPFIDQTYRTLPAPRFRAVGGMSRGAGWALQLGLARPDLFSIIGLHSLAVFQRDASKVTGWVQAIPSASRPTIFMDIGESDQELASARQVEASFTQLDVPHEWHLYSGDHTEKYWSAHVEEYIRWYAKQWNKP